MSSPRRLLQSSHWLSAIGLLACASPSPVAHDPASQDAATHDAATPEPTATATASNGTIGELGYALMQSDVVLQDPMLDAATRAAFADERRAFALSLYHQIKNTGDNVFYSPHSISTALAMAYVGARGVTRSEMATALKFQLPDSDLHAGFNALQRALLTREQPATENSSGLTLETHNDIWAHVNPGLRPLQTYVDALALDYSAPVKLVDFDADDGETARTAINQEVGRQTHDNILELIPSGIIMPYHTTMVLTNTIYMKAAWASPFVKGDTHTAPFTNAAGGTVSVEQMHQVGSYEYAETGDLQALRIPYVGGEVALTILLPAPGTWSAFESTLATETLADVDAQFASKVVSLTVPKLKLKSRPAMKPALQALGMQAAFVEGAADFSGIGPNQVYIQEVIHEAFIELDETGTEAGAATAVVFGNESAGPQAEVEFTADRPFFFFIEDIPTRSVLFAGRVTNPE
jgi:serpin B